MNMEALQIWWQLIWVQAGVMIILAWILQHFAHYIVTKIIRRAVHKTPLHRLSDEDLHKRQDTLISVLSVLVKIVIWTTVVYSLIRLFFPDIDMAPVFASAGIAGIAFGFGAQSLVKDFLAGMFILIENQYRVGDVVEINTATGTVEKMTLRITIIRDIDGNVHYFPNGTILHATNKTMDFSKIYFTLTVHPDTDLDKLTSVIAATGERLAKDKAWKDKIIEPPKFYNIGAFNEKDLEINILGKTKPAAQWEVTSEMKRRLLKDLARNKIELS